MFLVFLKYKLPCLLTRFAELPGSIWGLSSLETLYVDGNKELLVAS
jgi:hypothetical protein